MPGSLTTPGRPGARDDAPGRVAFRHLHGVGTRNMTLSRLNGWPMRPPVNASPKPSRATAHDSGPMWIANSFIVRDLHSLLLAGLPALRKSSPLYPTVQTSKGRGDISHLGQKATFENAERRPTEAAPEFEIEDQDERPPASRPSRRRHGERSLKLPGLGQLLRMSAAMCRARMDPVRRSPRSIPPFRSSRRCSRGSDVDRRSQVPSQWRYVGLLRLRCGRCGSSPNNDRLPARRSRTTSTGMVALSSSAKRNPAAGCILVYPTGEMVFTRIPCSAPSRARMRINPTTAHLAAA